MKKVFTLLTLVILFAFCSVAFAEKVVVVPLGAGVSENNINTVKKEFQYNVTPAMFKSSQSSNSTELFWESGGGAYLRYGLEKTFMMAGIDLYAPVSLPDGAEITAFKCYAYDNDATEDFGNSDVRFMRRLISKTENDGGNSFVAPIIYISTDNSSTEIQPFEAPTIDNPVVDNFNYFYWVYYFLKQSGYSNKLAFYGCQITYLLEVITP